MRGNFKKVVIFGTKHFVGYARHVWYLGCPLLGRFTVLFPLGVFIEKEIFKIQLKWKCSYLNTELNPSCQVRLNPIKILMYTKPFTLQTKPLQFPLCFYFCSNLSKVTGEKEKELLAHEKSRKLLKGKLCCAVLCCAAVLSQ